MKLLQQLLIAALFVSSGLTSLCMMEELTIHEYQRSPNSKKIEPQQDTKKLDDIRLEKLIVQAAKTRNMQVRFDEIPSGAYQADNHQQYDTIPDTISDHSQQGILHAITSCLCSCKCSK